MADGTVARERRLRVVEDGLKKLYARRDKLTAQLAELERDIEAAVAERDRVHKFYGVKSG